MSVTVSCPPSASPPISVTASCPNTQLSATTTIVNPSGNCFDASLIESSSASNVFATCNGSSSQAWTLQYTAQNGGGFALLNSSTPSGPLCLDGGGQNASIYMNSCYPIGSNAYQLWIPTTTSTSAGVGLINGFQWSCINDAVTYASPSSSSCLNLMFNTTGANPSIEFSRP